MAMSVLIVFATMESVMMVSEETIWLMLRGLVNVMIGLVNVMVGLVSNAMMRLVIVMMGLVLGLLVNAMMGLNTMVPGLENVVLLCYPCLQLVTSGIIEIKENASDTTHDRLFIQ